MKTNILISSILLLVSTTLLGNSEFISNDYSNISPLVRENETYEDAKLRIENAKLNNLSKNKRRSFYSSFPSDNSVPLNQINPYDLPQWSSYSQINQAFIALRNARNLTSWNGEYSMPRRLSWLYPDDGCYSRAEYMKYFLESWNFPETKKLFIFGNLLVSNAFHPDRYVRWVYHVVPALSLGNQVYVLDPALHYYKPLTIQEWAQKMNGFNAQFSICDKDTFSPTESCINPIEYNHYQTQSIQQNFLNLEWNRVLELGMNPFETLGNNPPWVSSF